MLDNPPIAALKRAQDDVDQAITEMNRAVEQWQEALRDARSAGWTLRELGELLGVTPQRIHQLTGTKRMRRE